MIIIFKNREMLKNKLSLFVITLFAAIISCDRPDCKNKNLILANYSPESREYKTELISLLKSPEAANYTFWFKQYVESGDEELLYFNIQGRDLCAVLVLNVEDWSKLKELRHKKGITFRGAEFKNLTFDIQEDTANIKFIFKDFSSIID
ncbi:MAG TPA: hypothetical protein DF296_03190 [Candidatus Margulisbacteria bacterium]|nr:hypothetical protein [Candidatus Margulisiibacteriota bacterium]